MEIKAQEKFGEYVRITAIKMILLLDYSAAGTLAGCSSIPSEAMWSANADKSAVNLAEVFEWSDIGRSISAPSFPSHPSREAAKK